MPGSDFHLTRLGVRFFEVTLPRIADEIANLANAVSALVALLRDRLPPPATTTTAPPPPSSERT